MNNAVAVCFFIAVVAISKQKSTNICGDILMV